MGDVMAQVRSVFPIFLIVALVVIFGVFVARRAGFFADTVTVSGSTAGPCQTPVHATIVARYASSGGECRHLA